MSPSLIAAGRRHKQSQREIHAGSLSLCHCGKDLGFDCFQNAGFETYGNIITAPGLAFLSQAFSGR
jgi:hypothetical protein